MSINNRYAALRQFKNGMPTETKEKIRMTLKEKYKNDDYRKSIIHRTIVAMSRPDVKLHMSIVQKGNTNGFKKGNKLFVGEKNPMWKGGICKSSYANTFCKALITKIRKRDNYTCKLCNKENSTTVHHIDYNKQNSSETNLITLCKSCHSKTNAHREMYIRKFASIMNKMYRCTNIVQYCNI